MDKGNILVIGNSGVGKSTLVNAVLGEERAETSRGISGTTKELKIYSSDSAPFNIVDSVGFEPSWRKRTQAINAVKKWSKEGAKGNEPEKRIDVIWFCVDGTAGKLFPQTIESLSRATKMWASVPVIVVITKSYAEPERKENTQIVYNAFARQKKFSKNLKAVIPVVAWPYQITDDYAVPPQGIIELIDTTVELLPEGRKAADRDIASFKLKRKRALSHATSVSFSTLGAAVGAAPLPFADAAPLCAIETAEIKAISAIYEIKSNDDSSRLIESLIEVGTVSLAAKSAISALKLIPGINIAGSVLNATIAACIVMAVGEGSRFIFEKVYLGEASVSDLEWAKRLLESRLADNFISKATEAIEAVSERGTSSNVSQIISDIVSAIFKDETPR
ncbi:MAG: 50S ribosome-binding GTPase [Coriobacteriaceae bacterium]|nr:50S ribosome-binding GTPase [Coriobacteriaceae bacterium]